MLNQAHEIRLYDVTYHAFEVRMCQYHGRGGWRGCGRVNSVWGGACV